LRSRHPAVAGRSFFLINQPPASERSVVMGLSNKTELLVHMDAVERDGIQLVRRFSGGGTVFIDQHCWMATMLVHKHAESDGHPPQLPHPLVHPSALPPYPNKLMEWTRDFYSPVFSFDEIGATQTDSAAASSSAASSSSAPPPFSLTGHDYCFSSRKFGGNAPTITRDRWLHHTSFLWQLDALEHIETYLQNPAKQPEYRAGRSHTEFLTSLREVWTQVEERRGNNGVGSNSSAADAQRLREELVKFERGNAPSTAALFALPPPSATPDVTIPPSLSSRLLQRLSHFYRLEYPALDEIDEAVRSYAQESNSSVKILDYNEERLRAKQAAIDAAEKARVAAEAAAAAATAAAAAAL